MLYCVVPPSLTNYSFPTDIFIKTVLVAQSLLKLEPFLLCSRCMFLYFFMDFLNVLLCCPYFSDKLPTDFFNKTVLVAQSLLKLEPFLYIPCMFLYFFMNFLGVLLCCPFFNKLSVFSLFSHFLSKYRRQQ